MSAVMATRLAPAPATAAGPVTQVRVVRAEWTKLRALRSTRWCALIAVVLVVGLGAAIAGSGAPYKISAANPAQMLPAVSGHVRSVRGLNQVSKAQPGPLSGGSSFTVTWERSS